MNEKIKVDHLGRAAVVYVRQSSPEQVRNNLESQRLQYAMKQRISGLGWGDKAIQVVDDDLGITANGSAERKGFDRLIGQVACGHIGLVAAREVTRLARNSGDWQRLIELCRQTDTLVMDHESVYDVRTPNDRLLLGIKGNISSYELDVIRVRALDALREKARRGALVLSVPAGYVKTPDKRIEITPDLQVRETVDRVFAKFLELGSARRTVRWFRESGILLPGHQSVYDGRHIQWNLATIARILRILNNPVYAGVYVYGRPLKEKWKYLKTIPQARAGDREADAWPVVIPNSHEGYIDSGTFERIHRMLDNNTQRLAGQRGAGGAARHGKGLLSGLLRCALCGRLLHVAYLAGKKTYRYRYECFSGDGAQPRCRFLFNGLAPDELIERAVLQVLTPLTVETAEQAFLEHDAAENEQEKALARECERTRYEAERAWRQYDAIEPENRLVAVSLERRWNKALEQQREAEDRLAEIRASVRGQKRSREDFLAMAAAFPDIWRSPSTDIALKKRIVRALIEEISTEEIPPRDILLRVHWRGGNHTEYRFAKPMSGDNGRKHPVEAITAIIQLRAICDDRMIAKYLNQNSVPRAGGEAGWNSEHVKIARKRRSLSPYDPVERKNAGFMTLKEASAFLGMSPDGLQSLAIRGEAAHERPLPTGPYIFRRADIEGQNGDRLRAMVQGRLKRKLAKTPINGGLFEA